MGFVSILFYPRVCDLRHTEVIVFPLSLVLNQAPGKEICRGRKEGKPQKPRRFLQDMPLKDPE